MKSLIVLAVFGLCTSQVDAQDAKDKLAALEGRWNVTSLVVGGQPFPDKDKNRPTKLLIKGGKATFFADGEEMPNFRDLTLRPHPAPNANAIDIVRDDHSFLPCLFDLAGDDFKLAIPLIPPENAEPGFVLPKPESFDSKDKPVLVFTMTKAKD